MSVTERWRDVSVVKYERKMLIKIRDRVCKTVIKPAVTKTTIILLWFGNMERNQEMYKQAQRHRYWNAQTDQEKNRTRQDKNNDL